jgi:hypothetical protein
VTHFLVADRYPNALPSAQLFLLFVFVTAYVCAVSGFFGVRGRWRAAGIALLAAIGLCLAFKPWTTGVLLVAGSVGGVGLFIAITLLISRMLGVDRRVSSEDEAPLPGRGADRGQTAFPARAEPSRVG